MIRLGLLIKEHNGHERAVTAPNKSYNLSVKCCEYSRSDTFQAVIIGALITKQHKYLDQIFPECAKMHLERQIRIEEEKYFD